MYSSICDFLRPSAGSLIGNLMRPLSVRHHFRHQRGIFGRNVFVVEGLIQLKSHHVLVEASPRHSSDASRHCRRCDRCTEVLSDATTMIAIVHGNEARQERALDNCGARRRCESCRRRWRWTPSALRLHHRGARTARAHRARRAGWFRDSAASASSTVSAMSRTPSPCVRDMLRDGMIRA